MKCVHTFGTSRHKRHADITLLFEYIGHATDTIILETRSEVKVTVARKLVRDTPPSQDASIYRNNV